jgi:hypothetical protein
VTVSGPPDMTRYDVPIESAVAYARAALLGDPDVNAHLLDLAHLPDAARVDTEIALRAGVELGRELARSAWGRYKDAREGSVLREQFEADELDYLVSIIRERHALEREHGLRLWGLSVPVNPDGAGYGRAKDRARAEAINTIELGVADLVGRLNPERKAPYALAVAHPATVRQTRRRLRRLRYR